MDATYSQPLIEMGVSLTQLAIRGTATAVTNKIKTIKDEKSTEKIRSTYDEIVNELLSERDEAVRIAQSYKSELERIVISDEDIEHLHNTVSRLLDLIKQFSPGTPVENLEVFKDLISVDTLKTMQLLGFNYKAAIGEPLTQLCATAITKIGSKNNVHPSKTYKGNK